MEDLTFGTGSLDEALRWRPVPAPPACVRAQLSSVLLTATVRRPFASSLLGDGARHLS